MKILVILVSVTATTLAVPYIGTAVKQWPSSIHFLPQTSRTLRSPDSDDTELLEEDKITTRIHKVLKNPLHDPLFTHNHEQHSESESREGITVDVPLLPRIHIGSNDSERKSMPSVLETERELRNGVSNSEEIVKHIKMGIDEANIIDSNSNTILQHGFKTTKDVLQAVQNGFNNVMEIKSDHAQKRQLDSEIEDFDKHDPEDEIIIQVPLGDANAPQTNENNGIISKNIKRSQIKVADILNMNPVEKHVTASGIIGKVAKTNPRTTMIAKPMAKETVPGLNVVNKMKSRSHNFEARGAYDAGTGLGGGSVDFSSGGSGPVIGVFSNANIGGCAVPVLLNCSPSIVSGTLSKPHSYGYGAGTPAYRTS